MNKRLYSIYDFPDYQEFFSTYDDSFPSWYIDSVVRIDRERRCRYCGEYLPAMRKELCSSLCEMYYIWAIHDDKINSLRRTMHRHYKFTCSECHLHLSYFTPATVELPINIGEVDHIVPLNEGGRDVISNLQLLCIGCHKKKTKKQLKKNKKI